jgi:hypothetical protein
MPLRIVSGRGALACALVLGLATGPTNGRAASRAEEQPPARLKLTGTFTSLTYNQQGGDVLRTEIRILGARRGLQATVQVAEGSASNLVLADRVVAAPSGKISFVLPPNDLELRSFEGVVTAKELDGTWTYTHAKTERVKLRRGRSYWD